MRIAIFENLPPGGAKRAAYELGRFLAPRHELDLYRLSTTSTSLFDLAPFVRNVHVYPFTPLFGLLNARLVAGRFAPRSYNLFGPLRRLHRRMARDLRTRGYDVVFAHTDGLTQSPYLLRWLGEIPSVYFCQEILRVNYERALLEQHRRDIGASPGPMGILRVAEDRWVLRRLAAADLRNLRAAKTIVVNSYHSRERVWAAYGRDAIVCYLGVDAELFAPMPDVIRKREVLSVGGPLLIKGHEMIIGALGCLPPGPSRPALRIVTPSSRNAEALQALARARAVDLMIEVGLEESALIDRYRRAIATVCAARLEPFGFTPIESMACGTPVIAIREGGFRETIRDGETGLLVEPEPQALAQAIGILAQDPARLEALGRQGREHVRHRWSWDRSGSRLEAILLQAVE